MHLLLSLSAVPEQRVRDRPKFDIKLAELDHLDPIASPRAVQASARATIGLDHGRLVGSAPE
jgi:hypothetical protein